MQLFTKVKMNSLLEECAPSLPLSQVGLLFRFLLSLFPCWVFPQSGRSLSSFPTFLLCVLVSLFPCYFSFSQVSLLPRFLLSFLVSLFPRFLAGVSLSQVRSVSFLVSCFPSSCPRFLVSWLGFSSVRSVSFIVSCFPFSCLRVLVSFLGFPLSQVGLLPRSTESAFLLKISSPCFSVPFEALKLKSPVENQVAYSFSACNDIDDSTIKEVKIEEEDKMDIFVAGMLWGATGLVG